MAIYHCSVQIIGRNAGRSSVAAAAYRAGENLKNEYDGVEHDFTKKNWVEYKEIILPENAPKEYADRGTLWNAVELSERSKDAQLCREFEVALPVELTREQQIEVVRRFVREKLTAEGMVADIAIHNPPVTNDRHQPIDANGDVTKDTSRMQFINPHAHILATVRPMDENGAWEKKSEIEYLCKRGDEEKGFTASEYRTAKENGWEKQYPYADGKKKVWLTAAEGKERGLERLSRTPKTSKYGRKNAKTEYWNAEERVLEWRQHWEKVVNEEFEKIHSETRIDCRSFKDQGREDELPTLHMGTSATNMEKRAARELHEGKTEAEVVRSDIGDINRQIKEHNSLVRQLKAKLDAAVEKAKDAVNEIARKLEGIRAKIIGNHYQEAVLFQKRRVMESMILPEGERLKNYKTELDKIGNANNEAAKELKRLQGELKSCMPHQLGKKRSLQKSIQILQEQVEQRNEYAGSIARRYGYESPKAYRDANAEHARRCTEYARLAATIDGIRSDTQALVEEYEATFEPSKELDTVELATKRQDVRAEMETVTYHELREKYGTSFDFEMYVNSKKQTDRLLGIGDGKQNRNLSNALQGEESWVTPYMESSSKMVERTRVHRR